MFSEHMNGSLNNLANEEKERGVVCVTPTHPEALNDFCKKQCATSSIQKTSLWKLRTQTAHKHMGLQLF